MKWFGYYSSLSVYLSHITILIIALQPKMAWKTRAEAILAQEEKTDSWNKLMLGKINRVELYEMIEKYLLIKMKRENCVKNEWCMTKMSAFERFYDGLFKEIP